MTTLLKRCGALAALALALSLPFAGRAGAQDKTASLSGDWNVSIVADHVVPMGLTLHQDGTKITGTLMLMGNDVPIEGEFVDNTLTIAGDASVMGGDAHLDPNAKGTRLMPTKLTLTGAMKDDGTLAGQFATPRGSVPWTAERFHERKTAKSGASAAAAKPSAAPPKPPSPIGSWDVEIRMDGGVLKLAMMLNVVDGTISGMAWSDHTGLMELRGTCTDRTLRFTSSTKETGDATYEATLKDDGTISGTAKGAMFDTLPWTAVRSKT
jgi:hypothetical protein